MAAIPSSRLARTSPRWSARRARAEGSSLLRHNVRVEARPLGFARGDETGRTIMGVTKLLGALAFAGLFGLIAPVHVVQTYKRSKL